MNIHRDHLDDAIDRVAQRLTRVDDDAQFASRIIGTLPERLTWFGWLTHAWAPRLAMMAIVAGTLAFWSSIALPRSAGQLRHTTEVTASAPPLASVANTNWPQLVQSINAERRAVREVANRALQQVEPIEPFEGLPSLVVHDAAPAALPAQSALTIAPLVIDELPLTAESFPERE